MNIQWAAYCSSCERDMGTVEPPGKDDCIDINNVVHTAYVADSTCPNCGIAVYRVHRKPKMVIQR